MNVFIDTNVFLSFYHFTSDDLEELRKLIALLRQQEIVLILPEQTDIEFRRNRENKIADSLKRLREQRLNLQFPQLCKGYEEYDELRRLQSRYEDTHSKLLEKIGSDVTGRSLRADGVINELFVRASRVVTKSALLAKARLRVELGNPPGKPGSLGDAINWEALLESVPHGKELHIISDDKDFSSVLDETRFNPFLLEEWTRTKEANICFYNKLSTFFRAKFPHIRLADEYEKETLIRDLAASSSFARTHKVLLHLSLYSDFSTVQLMDIVHAFLKNRQIYLIIGDPDVTEFLRDLIPTRQDQIEPVQLQQLRDLYQLQTGEALDATPAPPYDEITF